MATPEEAVREWHEAEGAKDSPFIPLDWPEAHWRCLAGTFPDLRTWIAHQPHAPEAVIRDLARCEDWRVRYWVAMKRNLPPSLLAALADDPEALVRGAVARNAKAPPELVARLAKDPDEDVARIAALRLPSAV